MLGSNPIARGARAQTLTAPEPTPRGAYGYAVAIQDDIMIISESWAEVEEHGDCGRLHVYKLGEQVETHEPVEARARV